MRKLLGISSFIVVCTLLIWGCQKEELPNFQAKAPTLPATAFNYVNTDNMPAHFKRDITSISDEPFFNENGEPILDVSLAKLGVTNDGATLGRVLFYDPQLSLNNTVACASCHSQANGFADPEQFSKGFKGAITTRNSMTIVNPIFNGNLFWDSRSPDVRSLVLEPVQNHIEMGMESLNNLSHKLARTDYYPALFEKAFGTTDIDENKIGEALTQFLNAMVSHDTKFDKGVAQDFANFTPSELIGKELFFSEATQCASCHSGTNFSAPDNFRLANSNFGGSTINNFGGDFDGGFNNPYMETAGTANIGLDVEYDDNGRGDGKFKIPTLRNIALTAPYMHDGRYNTLEEVIDHYDHKIQPHKDLDRKFMKNGQPQKLGLSSSDKKALIDFLHTLTDDNFVKDPKFSDPFVN